MSYFLVEVRPIIALIGAIFENAWTHLQPKVNMHTKRGRLAFSTGDTSLGLPGLAPELEALKYELFSSRIPAYYSTYWNNF